MSFLYISRPYSKENKRGAITELLENTVPGRDFYLLVIGAIILAASGILIDSISLFVKSYFPVEEHVLISFFPNIFFDMLIAVVSGFIATYGLIRPKVDAMMTDIDLFDSMSDPVVRAGSIFLLNVFGILVGSIFAFSIFGLRREYEATKNNVHCFFSLLWT